MKISTLWNHLSRTKFARINKTFLRSFRQPGMPNNRLAAWDPLDPSLRYFKFLLFHVVNSKNKRFFRNYAKIGPTLVGNPVHIPVHFRAVDGTKISVNLDHFLAVEEYTFLKNHMGFNGVRDIVEIGAGFGRTAQSILKLAPRTRSYTIIDLPNVLALSSCYLRRVLKQKDFRKLKFIGADSLETLGSFPPCDLAINIDSFQEMPRQTIKYYFQKVIGNCRFFYSKNPIGKYRPESVGLMRLSKKNMMDVFSLGLSRELIDIFDKKSMRLARKKHISHYLPTKSFKAVAFEPLGIFPYYLHVLYKNDNQQPA